MKRLTYREDYLRRFHEALERARKGDRSGMSPPVNRVKLLHETEQVA